MNTADYKKFIIVLMCIIFIVTLLHFNHATQRSVVDSALHGLILLAAAFMGQIIGDRYLRKQDLSETRSAMEKLLLDPTNRLHLESLYRGNVNLQDSGITRVLNGVLDIQFPEFKAGYSKNEMSMLFVGLNPSRLSASNDHVLLTRLSLPDARLRILLAEPRGEVVRNRGRTREYAQYGDTIQNELVRLINLFEDYEARGVDIGTAVDIRFYDCTPSCLYVQIDNRAWFGPLWTHGSSARGPFIEVYFNGAQKPLAKHLSDQFESMWRNARPMKWAHLKASSAGHGAAKRSKDTAGEQRASPLREPAAGSRG